MELIYGVYFMKHKINVGDMFGFWRVLEEPKKSKVLCECTGCNQVTRHVEKGNLIRGSKSCGCQSKALRSQTSLEKFGVVNAFQSEEKKVKIKESMIERYGVENPNQSPEIKSKIKKTNMDKYGSFNPMKNEEIRKKASNTWSKKTFEEMQKANLLRKETNLKKYGYLTPLQDLALRQQGTLAKYGVPHHQQLPENRDKLSNWCSNNTEKLFQDSKGQVELLNWISTYESASKYRDKLEIDIFIPSLKLGIEYNGIFRHDENHKDRTYHLNKTKFFSEKGIDIIHVWDWEWSYRKQQVQSFLLSRLGKNQIKIGARECEFIWSNDKDDIKLVKHFFDEYHIQGSTNCTWVVKVLHQQKLVAAASFKKHHRDSSAWTLNRFCVQSNTTIAGALSKISKLACSFFKEDLISWADRRLTNGLGYIKAGWILEDYLPPDYFYHQSGKRIVSKQSRQKKSIGTPEGMTEHEHAIQDGLVRVWDCGKIRFRFKFL
jgi:hypothetical protein